MILTDAQRDYCSNQCPIGEVYVPQVTIKDLPNIILEMVASLNSVDHKTERLIEIAADGAIEDAELQDFVKIQEELERISVTIETLQLWSEKMKATGVIDMEKYDKYKKQS
jgi:hypothetical protein